MSASDQSTDCKMLYKSLLKRKNDESEQNSTRSGDEDEFLLEVGKEYKSDDTLHESFKNEKNN